MTRKRRINSVAATALLSLLLAVLTLPLCSAVFACVMPCCDGSGAPAVDYAAMPSSAGTDTSNGCSTAFVQALDRGVVLAASSPMPQLPPAAAPRTFTDVAVPPASAPARRTNAWWSTARRLHVLNDIFLI